MQNRAVFLHKIGEEGLEKYNTFKSSEEQKKKYRSVESAFENFCILKSNETVEKHIFVWSQCENENFPSFVTDLKKAKQLICTW